MTSGPHATLVLPRTIAGDITVIDALAAGNDLDITIPVGHRYHPHWFLWVELYTDDTGGTVSVCNDGTLTVSVAPTAATGYASYLEAITGGTIELSGSTGPVNSVNWSGHTAVVRIDPGTGIVDINDVSHYRYFIRAYYA